MTNEIISNHKNLKKMDKKLTQNKLKVDKYEKNTHTI